MISNKVKLASAALALLLALVLLASGTFAWFTLSQKPLMTGLNVSMEFTGEEWPFEISLDGVNYSKTVKVGQLFTNTNGEAVTYLRPISTLNGVDWYLSNYDQLGGVSGFRPVDIDSVASCLTKQYRNVLSDDANYLVYYDMWVRTLDKDTDYNLKISNPLTTSKILDEERQYGSYVVSVPLKTANGYTFSEQSEDATCCIRIGFLILNPNGDGTYSPGQFTIYEPNMNKMCSGFTGNEQYSASQQLIYVAGSQENTGIKVGEYDTMDYRESTLLPYNDGNGNVAMGYNQHTISQSYSSWDWDELANLGNAIPDSRNIETFGEFYNNQNDTCPIALVPHFNENYLDTDPRNKGVLIRVFIWLEGQDVDCWNEIREGSVYANLEFKGDPVN